MTVRLTVRRALWRSHVAGYASAVDGLVPVVKGNGYGFGRKVLMPIAAELANVVCVGTIHELDEVPAGVTPVVLTPAPRPPPHDGAIATVATLHDVIALAGWKGSVMVKLRSSMRRYGAEPHELAALQAAIAAAGMTVSAYALHLPLAGDDSARVSEVSAWLPDLDDDVSLWLSHIGPATFAELRAATTHRELRIRVGTALWHGNKAALQLSADVVDVRAITAGTPAGYHHHPAPADGHIVLIAAGSANGIAALGNGASPFHFARQRLALVEPPHMHTSMVFVASGQPLPVAGDRVDVQRPLINTLIDELEWR